MDRKLLFVINPISGTRSKHSLEELIRDKTTAAGLPYVIYPSTADGDYSHLHSILEQEKITDVVIAGGDGTINQTIGALRQFPVQFGILPMGSGNGLAFTAHIPKNTPKALDIVLQGKSQLTDGFLVNGSFACMLVGLGFDAQVAHDFARDPRRGLTTYVKKTIANFIKAQTYPFILHTKEKEINTDALFISIANSNQFGNNFTIAPKASMHDGLLDVVIMTRQNRFITLVEAMKQITGYNDLQSLDVLDERAHLLYFQTDELTVTNPKMAPMHIDGDPVSGETKITVSLLKDSFRLIVGY